MNSHNILRTAVKIGGIALIVYTVIKASSAVPLFLGQLKSSDFDFPVVSIISSFLIPLMLGLVFWIFPASVANTIIRNELPIKSEEKFLSGVEKIAIRVLGIYLLYHGITDFVSQYAAYHQATEMFGKNINFSGKERFTTNFIVSGIQIVLALLLMLGATGISNLLRKARNAP